MQYTAMITARNKSRQVRWHVKNCHESERVANDNPPATIFFRSRLHIAVTPSGLETNFRGVLGFHPICLWWNYPGSNFPKLRDRWVNSSSWGTGRKTWRRYENLNCNDGYWITDKAAKDMRKAIWNFPTNHRKTSFSKRNGYDDQLLKLGSVVQGALLAIKDAASLMAGTFKRYQTAEKTKASYGSSLRTL